MDTFFKTFIICLILCLGFIGYKCFNADSYSPVIKTSDKSSVFSFKDNSQTESQTEQPQTEPKENKQDEVKPEDSEKFSYNCYFYNRSGQLVALKRELDSPKKLETVLTLLLKGPLVTESKKGYYSEIPANTNLINVKREGKKIIVNLTSKFGDGGGSQSIENRIKQLAKTIKTIEPNKEIYLYIEGKEVEYLGGDGVYVKQPL